jgi:hypothetical protein
VSGGQGNAASGNHATVAGGYENYAADKLAAVGGGYSNVAGGYACVLQFDTQALWASTLCVCVGVWLVLLLATDVSCAAFIVSLILLHECTVAASLSKAHRHFNERAEAIRYHTL